MELFDVPQWEWRVRSSDGLHLALRHFPTASSVDDKTGGVSSNGVVLCGGAGRRGGGRSSSSGSSAVGSPEGLEVGEVLCGRGYEVWR